MDIWHRVGRIVRFSNLGTLLFFTLNILLIVAVFGSSGSIVELICIYFFTVAISLPLQADVCAFFLHCLTPPSSEFYRLRQLCLWDHA